MDVDRSQMGSPAYYTPPIPGSPDIHRAGPFAFNTVPQLGYEDAPELPGIGINERTAYAIRNLDAAIRCDTAQIKDRIRYLIRYKEAVKDDIDMQLVRGQVAPVFPLIKDLGSHLQGFSTRFAGGLGSLEQWNNEGCIGAEGALVTLEAAFTELDEYLAQGVLNSKEVNRLLQRVSDQWRIFKEEVAVLQNSVEEVAEALEEPVNFQTLSTAIQRMRPEDARRRTGVCRAAERKLLKMLFAMSGLASGLGKVATWIMNGGYWLGTRSIGSIEAIVNFVLAPIVGKSEVVLAREANPQGYSDLLGDNAEEQVFVMPDEMAEPAPVRADSESAFQRGSGLGFKVSNPKIKRRLAGRVAWQFASKAQKQPLASPTGNLRFMSHAGAGEEQQKSTQFKTRLLSLFEQKNYDLPGFLATEVESLEALHRFQWTELATLRHTLTINQYNDLELAIKTQKWRMIDTRAHQAILAADSFRNLFGGKIVPEEADPRERVDLDNYISFVQSRLEAERERLLSQLREVNYRYEESGGRNLQCVIDKRQLEIRIDEIVRMSPADQIHEALLFFSGDYMNARGAAAQAQAIGHKMQLMLEELNQPADLQWIEERVNHCVETLDEIRQHLLWLENERYINDYDGAFAIVGQVREVEQALKARIRECYATVVHADLETCRKRMLADLHNELAMLQKGFDANPRVLVLEQAIAILRQPWQPKNWLQLNKVLNEPNTQLRNLLFRDYGTVQALALQYGQEQAEILLNQWDALCYLDDKELGQVLDQLLAHWRDSNPTFYNKLIERFPTLAADQRPALNLRSLRLFVIGQLGKLVKDRQQGLADYSAAETIEAELACNLVEQASTNAFRTREQLEQWPREHRYALFRRHLFLQTGVKISEDRWANPFLIELSDKLTEQPIEPFHYERLADLAAQAVGRPRLTDVEHNQLLLCYRVMRHDLGQRVKGSEINIAGLYPP